MKSKFSVLIITSIFCIISIKVAMASSEIAKAEVTNLSLLVKQLEIETKKLENRVEALNQNINEIKGEFSSEQKELCRKLCWIEKNAPILDQKVRDIGTAKIEIGAGYWEIIGITSAIFISIFAIIAVGAYFILAWRVERKTMASAEGKINRETGRTHLITAQSFYNHYEISNNTKYLESAIKLAAMTFDKYLHSLDQSKSENEELLCLFKNNMAWYLAEQKDPKDKEIARQFATYIEKRLYKYSKYTDDWKHTIDFVKKQYP